MMLHHIEVEDMCLSVVIWLQEPLAIRTYGHVCDRSWHGLGGMCGLQVIINHNGLWHSQTREGSISIQRESD